MSAFLPSSAPLTSGHSVTHEGLRVVAEFRSAAESYENLRVYVPTTLDQTSRLAANDRFLAYSDATGSGSCISVLPLTSYGKNHVPVCSAAYQQPVIRAHAQAVQDCRFHPFATQRELLFSVSADRFLKAWRLPRDGLVADMAAPQAALQTRSRAALRGLAPHPSVEALLAVRGSREIALFDVHAQQEVASTPESLFSADLLSFAWSADGHTLAATAKNKRLSLLDMRACAAQCLSQSTEIHSGVRFSTVDWLGSHTHTDTDTHTGGDDSRFLLTTGHDALTQDRELCVWDTRALERGPLCKTVVDGAEGALLPVYDRDTRLLALSGRGDSQLRIYSVADACTSPDPLRLVCSRSLTTEALAQRDVVRALTVLPKQVNALDKGEALRLLKMSDGVIQSISVSLSRADAEESGESESEKSMALHTTYGAAPRAENTLAAWQRGDSLPPATVSLSLSLSVPVNVNVGVANSLSRLFVSAEDEEREGAKAEADKDEDDSAEAEAEAETFSRSSRSQRVVSGLSSLWRWRHMYGREAVKDLTYYNLTPDLSALDSPIIAANEDFFAMPYRGGGGPIYISRHSDVGKVSPDCRTLNAHKASVQEIAFSPFHRGLMASGSFDCTIKLWDVHSLLDSPSASVEPLGELTSHSNSVRTCTFHPIVSHLLASTGQDATLRFFDVQEMREISCHRLTELFAQSSQSSAPSFGANIDYGIANNISFNYEGNLVAVACKDRHMRVLDVRQPRGLVFSSTAAAQAKTGLGRNLRVSWCARSATQDPLVSVSAGSHGLRQISLWDPRSLAQPITTKSVDNASGQLFPMFDEGLNTVFLAGKGDTVVRAYEIASLSAAAAAEAGGSTPAAGTGGDYLMEKACDFQTSREPIAGVCLLPKRVCDVRSVEVARLLKLTADSVVPLHFRVPRAEHLQNYFHDDVFPPVRARHTEVTVSDWEHAPRSEYHVANPLFTPLRESLRPEDMTNVSEKPAEPTPSASKSKIETFRSKIEKDKEEERERESQFARLQQLAVQNAQYHRNLSGGAAPKRIGSVVVHNPQQQSDEEDSDDNWDD